MQVLHVNRMLHILINSSNRLKGKRISEIDDKLTMDVKGEGRRGTVHGSQLYVVSDGGRLSRRIDEPISKQRLSTLLSATLKAKEEEKKVSIKLLPPTNVFHLQIQEDFLYTVIHCPH